MNSVSDLTGRNSASRTRATKRELQAVVRRLSGDDNIVRMRFTQPRSRDPNELGFGTQRSDVRYPTIPHSAPQPPDHLIDHVGDRTAIRDTPFDALRDELLQRDLALLEVAVGRALLHRGQAAHSPDELESPPLEQERLSRAFFGP